MNVLIVMRALLVFFFCAILNFTGFSQMILSGSAEGSCDCYELTDFTNESGSIWSPTTIDLTNPFDFSFEVNLGADDAFGADGMMFVLRQTGTTTGGIGNGMGYSGITNSIGVEIDTWNSSPAVASDIVSDHLGMSSNGTVEHDLVGTTAIPNIEDGAYHTFRATWNPITFDLEISLDGISVFTYNGDMVALFFGGTSDVFFGWTGGTGGVDNVQSVCMYREADFSSDYTTACIDQTITFTDESTSDLIYNSDEALTWAWNFGDGTTATDENPTHSFAATGTYTVTLTITDISGCSATHTQDIVITEGLDVTMSATDVTCFGADDGTATGTPTTGTGPYVYLWDDALTQTTTTATDLPPATYAVVVTDALGCVGTGSIVVAEPILLVIDSSVPTNASCGLANGTITVTASGGSPALEYSTDGGVTFFPTGDFIGLANGTYDVVVRDANGCIATTTTVVDLDSPLIIDDITTTPVSCGPLDDGTITATASSGVAPFEYSVDGGVTYQPSNFFDMLAAGTYTVTVQDAVGCTVSEDATVDALSTVIIDMVATTDASCNGLADGELTITASGGTPPYTYSADGGTTFAATPDFTGLLAGDYDVVVNDAAGCTATLTVTVAEPTLIVIDAVTETSVSCTGLSDGGFELTVSGGTGPYAYSNDGGVTFQVSPIFTGLSAGTYDLEIQDDNGCFITSTTDVTEPTPIVIDAVLVTDVTCNGLMDGEITVVSSGGTPAYEYRLDGGIYQVSPTFPGLGGGDYTVEVRDANGCAVTMAAFIGEADPIVLTMGADTTICLGGEATLCPTVTGGTMPYTYTWDGAVSPECLVTSTIGVHSLEVSDVNGCTSDLLNQVVDQYTPLSVFSSSAATICPGDDVVIAGEAAGAGPDIYSYEWSNDMDGVVLDGAVQTVNPDATTTYTLTVSSGCENTATATVVISTYDIPNIIITADVYEGCQALDVNFTSTTDPALVSSIIWDLGDGSIAAGDVVSHTYEDAICYDVSVDVTTINDCPVSSDFTDLICVWENPVAAFTYNPIEPDLFNTTVNFINQSEAAVTYDWDLGYGLNSTDVNPTNTYPELGDMSYGVELVAYSDKGCTDTARQIITIKENVVYYIPNAMTPNADPFNQTFNPVFMPGFEPRDFHLIIFNRWGEKVWESFDPSAGWNGTYDGVIVPGGVYVWELTFRENNSDKKHRDYGHVTVLK